MIRKALTFCHQLLLLARRCAKSPAQRLHIIRDYCQLYRQKGLTMEEYDEFEFEKRSESFRNDFLGKHEQRHYLQLLNPEKYYILMRNKYLTHKMLENTGVRKALLYAYYQPEGVVAPNDEIANDVAGLVRILRNKGVTECVVKATENSHGEGVRLIQDIQYAGNDATFLDHNGQRASLSAMLKWQPLIFESVIRQTQQFAAFNPSSVNTVRFMTALYPDNEVKIIATFIKIGRAGSIVDNAGDGGNVDVAVDIASGKLQYAIQYDGWRKVTDINVHPDTGATLNGVTIEHWDAIKAEVCRFQQALPYCRVAGWDIAITDEGPLVIEVNDLWDRTGQYFIRRGWRPDIRQCYQAWEQQVRDGIIPFPYFGRIPQQLSNRHLQHIISQ